MDPRSSNRQKTTTGNSKGVHRRGEGLGTGPVGRQDAYSGRKAASSGGGNRAAKIGGGSGTLIIIIIIIFMMMRGGGSGTSGGSSTSGLGSGMNDYTSSSTSNIGSVSSNTSFGDVGSLFGGFSGASTTSGWQNNLNNTGKLNKDIAPEAREKRTKILGNGQDTWTIMVYMCGTDLESRSGMASNDLGEMASANIPDNVNLIIYTGGCNGWKTSGISNKTNQIFKLESGRMQQLVADDGDKPMTDPDTLVHFLDYCESNYSANRKCLIFWDHGGGSITGYGYDEKHKNEGSMDLSEINQALKKSGQTFDWIGFDACLMATLETAQMCSNYADYLIASEETEPGIGWYHTKWVNAVGENTSIPTIELGQIIVDSFVEECNRVCGGQKTTLSVIDLAEFSATVPSKLNAFSTATTSLIKGSDYKTVSDARAGSREFATSSKIDQIDLVNFANSIGTEEAKALSEAVLGAVKYNKTSRSMTNAYGVSMYFPYKKASKVGTVTAINKEIGVDNELNKCMQAFAGLETTGQVSAGGQGSAYSSLLGMGGTGTSAGTISGSDAIGSLLSAFLGGDRSIEGMDSADAQYMNDTAVYDADGAAEFVANNQFDPSKLVWKEQSDGTHQLELSKADWNLIQNLQVNMFVDDGEGYVDMGLDNLYYFTEDGKLIGETDNTWFSIDNQPVAFYYEDTTETEDGETIVTGRVPAFVDGVRSNLIIVFDNAHPSGYIAGARFDYSDDMNEMGIKDLAEMTTAKGVTEISEGAKIDFICDFYDYDGNYQDSYMLGDQWTYSNNATLSYENVGANSKVSYLLTDIYNSEYWTPALDQK
ncbi:MAG TPA: peptidase C11 [Lachnospiraceae bacterium]|nr:peptidase C11 [Lachnospiraceae bacterium]